MEDLIVFVLLTALLLILGAVFVWCAVRAWPSRRARFCLGMGLPCLIGAVFSVTGLLLPWERGVVLGLLLAMDGLLLGGGIAGLSNRRHCTLPVTAVCVGIQPRGAGRSRSYSPELLYTVGGQTVRSVCSSIAYSQRRAEKYWPLGGSVTVFADPDQPDLTVDKSRAPAAAVWLTVVGCACLAFTVYACFGDVRFR